MVLSHESPSNYKMPRTIYYNIIFICITDSIFCLRFVNKLTSITDSLEKQQTSINEIYAEGAVEGYSAECPFCIGLCWPPACSMCIPKMISAKYLLSFLGFRIF